jgi:hypothetical protein
MATGEAAGIAAALACDAGGDVARVEVSRLRERLRAAGAIVDYDFARTPPTPGTPPTPR